MRPTQIVEALLFSSDAPLTAGDIARADESLDEDAVEAAIQELRAEYEQQGRAFQIYEMAGGYQALTRPDYAPYLERFATVPQSNRLSQAALEALAIVAYRQPIDRSEVEDIRGVASAGVLRTLADRGMIEVVGRGEGLGRPMLYGTTDRFLEHFGFRSLEDLPREEDLPVVLTERRPEPQHPEEGATHEAVYEPIEGDSPEAEDAAVEAQTPVSSHERTLADEVRAVLGADADREPDWEPEGEAEAQAEAEPDLDALDEGGGTEQGVRANGARGADPEAADEEGAEPSSVSSSSRRD